MMTPGETQLISFWNICSQLNSNTAFYGAGLHTKWFLEIIEENNLPLPQVIYDDKPKADQLSSIPVVETPERYPQNIDRIILSSDTFQKQMKDNLLSKWGKEFSSKLFDPYEHFGLRTISKEKKVLPSDQPYEKPLLSADDIWVVNISPYTPQLGPNVSMETASKFNPHIKITSGKESIYPTIEAETVIFNSMQVFYLDDDTHLAVRERAKKGKKIYIYEHSGHLDFEHLKSSYPEAFKELQEYNSLGLVHFLCTSERQVQLLEKHWQINPKDCSVIYETCFQNIQNTPVPSQKPKVVTVASIQPRKGTDIWLKAAIEVCRKNPEAEFHWYGKNISIPEYFHFFQQEVRSSSLSDRIIFHGHCQNPWKQIQNASVFVIPSRSDACPLSLQEAMENNLRVAGFNFDGIPELIGEAGCVVAECTPEALAGNILEILDNLDKPVTTRERYLNNFHPEIFIQRLNEALQR